jgi:hypothetical protein
MEFNLNSRERIVNHWMLQCDSELVETIGETPEYKENRKFVAKVTINGVELPFESLDNYFLEIYRRMEEEIRDSYKDKEAEVQRRLDQRMKDEAQPILDKLRALDGVLDDVGNLIKPYWDR